MNLYGRSQEVANSIIAQFKKGDLPEVLKDVFINTSYDVPCNKWSYQNRFIAAVNNSTDARGFKQWIQAGRKVSKGAKAFYILAPCLKKIQNDEGELEHRLYGFKSIAVFSKESTEVFNETKWQKDDGSNIQKENERLTSLPFYNLAKKWNLNVVSYTGAKNKAKGFYTSATTIGIGVENLATWTHELIHAADDRLNTLTKGKRQDPDNEIVAELGGATLLKLMGYDVDADIGGAWKYIKSYSANDSSKAISNCFSLINRVCKCIDYILKEADTSSGAFQRDNNDERRAS